MLQGLRTARAMPKALTMAILAAVLLLRVLIPQGWMPVQTDNGWQITICTGTGPMQMTMPALPGQRHLPGGQDHAPGDHPCTFAGFALAIDRAMPPMLALPPVPISGWLITTARSIAIGRGLAAPPPPATGPPGF
ncbi:hypothetical protein [Sphingomonas sp. MMS24-J13]|uniref:hypothetical protein n=1 Tax=Sphingomonas sp. MMS24-J13 TaxID=3238686 RepID=UPI00385059AC